MKAKIVANSSNLESVAITNLNSKVKANSDTEGYFSILAQPKDVLQISGENCITLEIELKAEDFTKKLFFIRLKTTTNQSKIIPLAEVEIKNYQNINAVSLGILSKPAKKYTPAERRLKAASSGIGVHQLINAISGRSKMLKKELKVEINEKLLSKLDNYFPKEYYIKNLKIPELYINGFQIYALDDSRVVAALKSKNKTLTAFLLTELSAKYRGVLE